MTIHIEHHTSRKRTVTVRRAALTVLEAADTWVPSPELARRCGCRTASLLMSLMRSIESGEIERRTGHGATLYRILRVRQDVQPYSHPWEMIDRWKAGHGQ